jgi:hypothetical protein
MSFDLPKSSANYVDLSKLVPGEWWPDGVVWLTVVLALVLINILIHKAVRRR